MIKINYYLQKRKEKRSPVLISIQYDGKRVMKSTGISIIAEQGTADRYWNSRKGLFKSNYAGCNEFNSLLDKIRSELAETYAKHRDDTDVREKLTSTLNAVIDPNNAKSKSVNILSEFLNFLEYKKKQGIANSTVKSYEATYFLLCNYSDDYKPNLSFKDINLDFFSDFKDFLSEKGLVTNTQRKIFTHIKSFMIYSREIGLHHNDAFKKFKIKGYEKTIIALTESEIKTLENAGNLSDKLDKTRILFLIQLYSGLRYSDLPKLKNVNLDEDFFIFNMKKTNRNEKIPLHDKLKNLLPAMPDVPVLSAYNSRLRELFMRLNLNRKVTVMQERESDVKALYELVSSHTGRKSFITHSLSRGVPATVVMEVSGHKDFSSFQKYINFSKESLNENFNGVF